MVRQLLLRWLRRCLLPAGWTRRLLSAGAWTRWARTRVACARNSVSPEPMRAAAQSWGYRPAGTEVSGSARAGTPMPAPNREREGHDFSRAERHSFRPGALAPEDSSAQPPLVNSFSVKFQSKDLGEFSLRVPGLHNVLNATAAIAVGGGLDIPVANIRVAHDNSRS